MEVGVIIAEGELSTNITTSPSNTCAAAVSGRSVNLNLGKGLNHLRFLIHSECIHLNMVDFIFQIIQKAMIHPGIHIT